MTHDAASLHVESLDDLLRGGIIAAKAGRRERARELLMRVVEQDETCLQAWLWLSGVVDSLEDREICLKNVLALDPNHAAARKGMAWVRQQRASQASSSIEQASPSAETESSQATAIPEPPVVALTRTPVSPAAAVLGKDFASRRLALDLEASPPEAVADSPVVARTRTPVSPAAAMLSEDFASRRPPPEPLPAPTPVAQYEFGDEYLCPYCASPTEPDDRRCEACGGGLWAKFRRQEKRSTRLWILLGFQITTTFYLGLLPLVLVIYVGLMIEATVPLQALLSLYLGSPTTLSPEVVDAAFAIVPRSTFLLLFLPSLLSLAVTAGLYWRWEPIYYLFLADALLGLLAAAASSVLVQGVAVSVIGIGLSLARLVSLLQARGDFEWGRRRILLRIDPGLGSSGDFLARGSLYAKRRMWALAVIHLRIAVSRMPGEIGCRASLIVAYIRLKRYDLAERALAEAEQIDPGDERVRGLRALLDELRSAGDSP